MDVRAVYASLTDGLTRSVRAEDLVYAAAGLPTREAVEAERGAAGRGMPSG